MSIGFGEWGEPQIVINDTDVTFFRGIPTRIVSWSSGDPFGDAAAMLEFPSITPYEVLGAADLFWLQPHAVVDIRLVRPDDSIDILWEGMIASIDDDLAEDDSVLTIECIGALYQLDYYVRSPENRSFENMRLYEHAITEEFEDKEALRTQSCIIEYPEGLDAEEGTGWLTRYSGAWERTLTGYVQRLLADMVHSGLDDGPASGQWTLMKNDGRQPVLKVRDEREIDYRVLTGAPGVTHNLKSDHSQANNVIFGEGTDESSTTWRNAEIDIVEVDEGLASVTKYHPLGWDETVHPADKELSESGAPTDPPPDVYNPNFVRVETLQQYGGGISLRDARRSAGQQVRRELTAGYFGTITLKIDPVEASRFEIKAGKNILLQKFKGQGPAISDTFDKLLELGIYLEDNRHAVMTRGQYSSVLVRLLEYMGYTLPTGSTNFTDVAGNTHQANIEKLEAAGIAMGYGDGTFGPNDDLTRGQLAGFMVRIVEWAEGTMLTSQHSYFYDVVGTTHEEDIDKAAENYLIFGNTNGSYQPNIGATRQQAGIVLQRMNRFLGGDMLEDDEGVLFHISQVQINLESATAELTVDSKFRDLATLSELIERNKATNKNPAKMLMANRQSANVDDTKFPWDYEAGSGSIPKESGAALTREPLPVMPDDPADFDGFFVYVNGTNDDPWKRWTIVPVVLAGKGSVQRSEIRAYDSSGSPMAVPFHAGVYGADVTEYSMPQQPFAPDAFLQPADSGEALSGYDSTAIVLWGQEGQRAGYWPGLESEGNPVTGILIDEGTWQFQLEEGEPVVWVAFYAEDNVYFQGRFYHGVQS